MKPSRFDLLIISVVILVALGMSLWARLALTEGQDVEIYVNNILYDTLSLSEPQTVQISGAKGQLTLSIKDNQAAIVTVDCPQRICQKMGPIKHRGQSMICIPNAVVIKISGTDDSDLDATTR